MTKSELIDSLKDIDVVDLQLDAENYRIGPQPGQHEAIQAIIEEQGDKLIDLAKDILDIGTSPIELIVVCESGDPGKYRVLEGNRRVTALKLLHEPALCANTPIGKRIHTLAVTHAKKLPKKLLCTIMDNKQAAFPWIRRKHDNGFGGAATVPWSAIQIRRANEAEGTRQVTLEAIDFVAKNPKLTPPDHQKLKRLPVTNLERILEDPSTLALLGIEVRNGELVCSFDQAWTLGALTEILLEIANKKIKVRDIYDEQKRKKYVQSVINRQATPPAKATEWAVKKGGLVASPSTGTGSKKTIRPISIHRRNLIPTKCKLQISHPRLNAIYYELRRKLVLDAVPNAISVMFRVFIEMSVDHYMGKKSISLATGVRSTLYNKLKAVADYMEQNKIMTLGQLKPVRLAASSPNEILSTETLNAYVHNMQVIPSAPNLRDSWDSIEPFVEQVWK